MCGSEIGGSVQSIILPILVSSFLAYPRDQLGPTFFNDILNCKIYLQGTGSKQLGVFPRMSRARKCKLVLGESIFSKCTSHKWSTLFFPSATQLPCLQLALNWHKLHWPCSHYLDSPVFPYFSHFLSLPLPSSSHKGGARSTQRKEVEN